MIIGRKAFSAGSKIRYEVDYEFWLERGRTLAVTDFTVTVNPDETTGVVPPDVVISQVSVTPTMLYFFVTSTVVDETFTVQVAIKDTLGESLIDTIEFSVLSA